MKSLIIISIISLSIFASEIYSDLRIEIYEKSSKLIKKLDNFKNIDSLKTFLKGGYADINRVKKDINKIILINKNKKILSDKEIIDLKNIIKKLQIYRSIPAA
ncbi:hypothetical protein [Nitrosophilus kaiyonis]|uniref:hypothetical protein n=1 Tax=Nitrosophilus kaiyonis TaxID=2930200 RepID=UPI002492043B|nr:hypothetical protein [Nitrosophilus kaiyonis]